MTPDNRTSLIGQRLPRKDSWSKVTGEAVYTADLTMPRMLFIKVVRSPLPHARILRIDLDRAWAVPGVVDIITGKDTAGVKWGVFPYTRDQEMLPPSGSATSATRSPPWPPKPRRPPRKRRRRSSSSTRSCRPCSNRSRPWPWTPPDSTTNTSATSTSTCRSTSATWTRPLPNVI